MTIRRTKIGISVATVVYAATFAATWYSTQSGTGLFGRPVSNYDIQRLGIDDPLVYFSVLGILLLVTAASYLHIHFKIARILALLAVGLIAIRLLSGVDIISGGAVVNLTPAYGLFIAMACTFAVAVFVFRRAHTSA